MIRRIRASLSYLWHCWIGLLVKTLVFGRVALVGAPLPSPEHPVLYVGFHRNGAVDGWAYALALRRRVSFMIAANLLKNPIARLFFEGVEVTRKQDDGTAASNRDGLERAVRTLTDGGALFVFPEGTSTLGSKHLAFMKGAALVAARAMRHRRDLRIVPLSVRYAAPQLSGSAIEVAAGEAFGIDDMGAASDIPDVRTVHAAIVAALEALAPDFESEAALEDAAAAASMAFLDKDMPYTQALYAAKRVLDGSQGEKWRACRARGRGCVQWQGVALFSSRPMVLEASMLFVSGVAVALGTALNLPPVLAARYAGARYPDGANVVLLWKVLVGMTVFLIYVPLLWGVSVVTGNGWLIPVHLVLTVVGARMCDLWRRSRAAFCNGLRYPGLRAAYVEARDEMLREMASVLATGGLGEKFADGGESDARG